MTQKYKAETDKDHFDELLPWYVNGTLAQDDRMWVDEFMRRHPDAASEFRMQQMLRTTLHENAAAIPADIGLDTLLKRVRQERRAAPSTGLLARLNEMLGRFFAGFLLTPATATAFAVIVAQAGVIGVLLTGGEQDAAPEYARMRAIEGPAAALEGPFLKINFDSNARESDLRFALISVGGTLVAGPSQLGDYFVKVPAARIAAASDQLRANALVESVVVVESLPNKG